MTIRWTLVAAFTLGMQPLVARADLSGCATPTPSPIPPVYYFTPLNGAAEVPTNAAIIFQPNTAVQVLLATSGATLVPAAGSDSFAGPMDIFHLTTALKPATRYQVSLVLQGNGSPLTNVTFTTASNGDGGTPTVGPAQLVAGSFVPDNTNPQCPSPAEYAISLSWAPATEAGQSTFVYEVVASDASGTLASLTDNGVIYGPGVLAVAETAVTGFASAGTALNVAVYAFDQAGHMGSASATLAVPPPPGPGIDTPAKSASCACAMLPGSAGWTGSVSAALLALLGLRIRRQHRL